MYALLALYLFTLTFNIVLVCVELSDDGLNKKLDSATTNDFDWQVCLQLFSTLSYVTHSDS